MRERESAGSWSFKPDGICSLNTIPLQSDTALILHFSSRLFCCCQHKPIPNKIPAYGYGGHKIHNEVQNGAGGPGPNPQAGRFWPTGSMFDTPNLTPSYCTSKLAELGTFLTNFLTYRPQTVTLNTGAPPAVHADDV